jgi:competence protein ComEC
VSNKTILITGDIEAQAEQKLIRFYKNKLKSDILIIPHHGSKTSSSLEFINQVSPQVGIIAVGLNNIYNLPNKKILNRYHKRGIKLYRTDIHGGIKIKIANDQISIDTAKKMYI